MKASRLEHKVVLLLVLAVAGCGTTSRSAGESAALTETGPDRAKSLPPCPATAVGFPLRERQRGVAGCPSDVQYRPGTYEGYDVAFGCLAREDSDSVVIVRGLGKKTYRQVGGAAPSEDDDEEKKFWRRLVDNVRKTAGVPSIHRSSRIHACRGAGFAIELRIHNFRDVDDAVRALGEWLARSDSSGEVLLLLEPKPEAEEPQ